MDPFSALVLIALLAAPTAFTVGAFKRARANGHFLPSREDWKPRLPSLPQGNGERWTGRWRPGRPSAGHKPPASPKQRRPLFQRLIIPPSSNARKGQTVTTPNGSGPQIRLTRPQQPTTKAPGHAGARVGQPGDAGLPASGPGPRPTSPPGGTMTTASGGGSASDLMSAAQRIIAEAEAGGLQSKARGGLVMGEGLKQLAAAMEQHARHLQETGLYPAYVWEPWRQGAAMAHAAASKATEGGNAAAELARRPMGEANGQAPHHRELNKR